MSANILMIGGTLLTGTALSIGGLFFHPILPIGIALLTSGVAMLTGEAPSSTNTPNAPPTNLHANSHDNHPEHCEKNINVIFSNQTYVDNRGSADNHEIVNPAPPKLKRTLTI